MLVGRPKAVDPLYIQIADYLREQLYENVWGVGDRIPSEPQLAKAFFCGLGTVKHSVDLLVEEGLLERVRGKDAYVAKPITRSTQVEKKQRDSLRLQNIAYTTEVLSQMLVEATDSIASRLGVVRGSDVLYLRRMRLTPDNAPLMLIESRINLAACPNIDRFDFKYRPLHESMELTSGQKITETYVGYGAFTMGPERAILLACDPKGPALCIERTVVLESDAVCEWGRIWMPPNRFVESVEVH